MDLPLPQHKIRSPQLERAAAFMGKVGNTLRRRKKKSSGSGGEELERDGTTSGGGGLDDDSDLSDGGDAHSQGRGGDGRGSMGALHRGGGREEDDPSPILRRRRAATGPDLTISSGGGEPLDCCGVSRSQITAMESSSPSSSGSHAHPTLTPPAKRKSHGIPGAAIWTGIKQTIGAGVKRRQARSLTHS